MLVRRLERKSIMVADIEWSWVLAHSSGRTLGAIQVQVRNIQGNAGVPEDG